VKTVGKLFRTTAFKLSLAYFVLFSLGAWVVLASVGQRVEQVLDEETAQTIDAEIARLTELYGEGGLRQLVTSIERRARAPGGSIFLVTTHAGEYIAGNVIASPMIGAEEGALDETIYRRRGEAADIHHHALAKLVVLPGEFRLLVGPDSAAGTWRLAVLAGLGRHARRTLRRQSDAGARRRHVGLGATHHGRRSRSKA
jgi:hypothetical protein